MKASWLISIFLPHVTMIMWTWHMLPCDVAFMWETESIFRTNMATIQRKVLSVTQKNNARYLSNRWTSIIRLKTHNKWHCCNNRFYKCLPNGGHIGICIMLNMHYTYDINVPNTKCVPITLKTQKVWIIKECTVAVLWFFSLFPFVFLSIISLYLKDQKEISHML